MVKENTVTLSLTKGMKQTEIGLIPEDWEYVNAEKYIDFITGFPFASSLFSNNGIKLLRGSNVKRNIIDWSEDITKYWEVKNSKLKDYELAEGDIVISMDGSLVGRSFGQIKRIDLPALLVQRVARVRGRNASTSYLKQLYCSEFFTKHCDNNKTASAIPHISPKDIKEYKILIPISLPEQQAIAEALSDADAWIESLEDLIAKKRLIKQGAMQELLTPKEGWEVKTLGEIGKFFSTNSLSRDKMNYVIGEIYNIHYGDIHTKFRSFFNIEKEIVPFVNLGINTSGFTFFCKQGDLVIADASEDELDIGKAIEMGQLNGKNVICGLHTIHFRPTENIFAIGYIGFLWQSHFVKNQIIKEAQGTKVLGISTGRLKDLEIKFPSMSDQILIATILSDMDIEIERLEQKLSKARQIKQGMIQELLTGRVRLV